VRRVAPPSPHQGVREEEDVGGGKEVEEEEFLIK